METQVRSSDRGTGWGGIAVCQTILFLCVLLIPTRWDFVSGQPQTKPKIMEQLRFRVTDSENDVSVAGATVSFVYWQKNATTKDRKEMEGKTDTNGLVEFPRVDADKMAVSVAAKGYRSCWRWIHLNESVETTTSIRLERWVYRSK